MDADSSTDEDNSLRYGTRDRITNRIIFNDKTLWNPNPMSVIMNRARETGQMCDVILIVDGKEFPCHRNIIASFTSYFDKVFIGHFTSKRQQQIKLPGIDSDGLELVLNYLYDGQICLDEKEDIRKMLSLIGVSKYIGINFLYNICVKYLKKNINFRIACEMASYFDEYKDYKLRQFAATYILQNFRQSYNSEYVTLLPYALVRGLVYDDHVILQKEEHMVELICKWLEHDWKDRRGHFEDLAAGIRYQHIEDRYKLEAPQINLMCSNLLKFAEQHVNYDVPSRVSKCLYAFGLKKFFGSNSGWSLEGICVDKDDCVQEEVMNKKLRAVCPLHHKVVASDSRIYRFSTEWNVHRNVFHYYDDTREKWINLPTPPTYTELSDMVYMNGCVYVNSVCMNKTFDRNITYAIYSYIVECDKWCLLPYMEESPDGYSPHAACMVAHDGVLYVLGGMTSPSKMSSDKVRRLDPRLDRWHEISPMPRKKAFPAGVSFNGSIYVSGGICVEKKSNVFEIADAPRCNDVMEYDPVANSWFDREPMLCARRSHDMLVNRNKMWVVGGGKNAKFAESFDPIINEWTPEFDTYCYLNEGTDEENDWVTGVFY